MRIGSKTPRKSDSGKEQQDTQVFYQRNRGRRENETESGLIMRRWLKAGRTVCGCNGGDSGGYKSFSQWSNKIPRWSSTAISCYRCSLRSEQVQLLDLPMSADVADVNMRSMGVASEFNLAGWPRTNGRVRDVTDVQSLLINEKRRPQNRKPPRQLSSILTSPSHCMKRQLR